MAITGILANRELDDYEKDDAFNFKEKGDAIKGFLEYNIETLSHNKMVVLYGGWGTGKTSLMKHISNTIDTNIYRPIFFHAWEHEKDNNLPLSLVDCLVANLETGLTENLKEFMKAAYLTFKSFASGVSLKASTPLTGLGLGMEVEISGDKIVTSLDKAFEKDIPSFFIQNEEFKRKFKLIETELLAKSNATKLLVLVDDLDRCEPENVLNLLTALKLFFTYSENTVFFCGIDKDAVVKAVRTKYQDVVKSEEYLEKVFDISFNMPKTYSLNKLLRVYFSKESERDLFVLEDFFNRIAFTNPRHLKKVLNKYEIIKSFATNSTISDNIRQLIPNVLTDGNGDVFETIYCLFFIVLYEFFPEKFTEIEHYNKKIEGYGHIYLSTLKRNNPDSRVELEAITMDLINKKIPNIKHASITSILNDVKSFAKDGFVRFLFIFTEANPDTFAPFLDDEMDRYPIYFNKSEVLSLFCKFLIDNKDNIMETKSDYKVWNLFNMAKYLL